MPGSGKTKLVDTAAVIATGHRAAALAVMSGRNAKEELYKQLAAAVLAGDQNIVSTISRPSSTSPSCPRSSPSRK
jgi:hypothetical protein